MPDGYAAPLCVVGKERSEWFRVALVEGVSSRSEFLDHPG
jgi:hypothetical protein